MGALKGEATSVRLSGLLAADRAPDAVVAWRWNPEQGRDVAITWADFRGRVEALAKRIADWPVGAVVLACDDRYAFAVGLFGAWRAGRLALAPPNAQPDTIERLAGRAVGVLSDRADISQAGSGLAVLAPLDVPVSAADTGTQDLGTLDPSAEVLELFTSGTTGDGKADLKRLAHLEEEVAYLADAWGADVADARVFSTASHQHLYGLLFGLLWPLCSGRAFQADTLVHAAELFPRMVGSRRCMLASVPSHLRRMVEHRDAARLAGHCVMSFSSGGPLAEATADAWSATVGAPPVEIFGSTETGGVAWRQQSPGPDRLAWTPFACVTCMRREEDGCLHVRSPFIGFPVGAASHAAPIGASLAENDTQSEGFTMGDRIALREDGRFVLEGRGDRVVKIAEKRVSLPLMEQHLAAHAYVEDAALLVVQQQGEARLGAVLVLDEAGAAFAAARGRRAIVSQIGDHLAGSWDRILLPRVWRLVDRMPEDAQGKVTTRALSPLFDVQGQAVPRPREAKVIEAEVSAECIVQHCSVPENLAQLEGHFEGMPIVPGVVQLQWAVGLAQQLAGGGRAVSSVEALKFKRKLSPGDVFTLRVVRIADDRVSFAIEASDDHVSSGRLVFAGRDCA